MGYALPSGRAKSAGIAGRAIEVFEESAAGAALFHFLNGWKRAGAIYEASGEEDCKVYPPSTKRCTVLRLVEPIRFPAWVMRDLSWRLFQLAPARVSDPCLHGGRVAVAGGEVCDYCLFAYADFRNLTQGAIWKIAGIGFRAGLVPERAGSLQPDLNDCGQDKNNAKGENEGTGKQLGTDQTIVHSVLLCAK